VFNSETDQKNYPFEGLVTSFYRNFPYYSVEYSTKISADLFVKSSGLRPRRLKIEHVWGAFPPRNLIVLGVLFFDVKFSSSILKGCSSNSKVDERVKLTPFFCPGQAA